MATNFCRQCNNRQNVQCFETLLLVTPDTEIPTLQQLGEEICDFLNQKNYAEWKNQGQTEKVLEPKFGREWIRCTLARKQQLDF